MRSFFAAFILLAALVPSIARANVIGTDMQNFNATTNGLDFVTVQSSETLRPGIFNLGLFLNYAVNTLPYFDDSSTQSRLHFNDTILGMDLNFGVGLTRNWDIGFSFPQVLTQSVEDQTGARGEFAQTGASEIRFNTKYRVYGDDAGGVALIASINVNRIDDNPWTGRDAGPIYDLEVAADTTVDRIAYGGNLGYRFRSPGTRIPGSRVEPLKDQFIASAAASYHMPDWDTKLIGEIFGSLPVQSSTANTDRSLTSLEALVGAKYDVMTDLALHAGAGAGIVQGVASPDWRVYAGLNYTFGPLWGEEHLSVPEPEPDRHLVQIVPAVPTENPPVERFRTQAILFKFDSDQMIGNYLDVLEELVDHLKKGFRELVVEGHTDSVGSDAYNQKLSQRRADAIRNMLISRFHLDGRKIKTIGYGESRPIADNGNYQGRQQNRRVEFEIHH